MDATSIQELWIALAMFFLLLLVMGPKLLAAVHVNARMIGQERRSE